MKKLLKKSLCSFVAAAMAAGFVPVVGAQITPMFAEDEGKVLNEWKFDFGSADDVAEGYTAVEPDRNVIASGDYGFIGNDGKGYKVSERYDSFAYSEGQNMNLVSGGTSGLYDGVGIAPDKEALKPEYTTGDYYPVSFGMYVERSTYYRVRATVTTLDPTKDAVASLYYERRHPVYTEETIKAGETKTVEFSVDVEDIYFEKSEPKGVFADDMLNIELLGANTALAALEIQQVEDGITLWVLGDSTVTDGGAALPYFPLQNYTGVGNGLSKYVPANVAVSNQGEGGLAANDNNHFNIVKNNIDADDYLYMEYGHNHKDDGVAGYLTYLKKYYDAANAVGAKMIYVGPIDRHNASQYDSAANTWSSTLNGFSNAAKAYTQLLVLGGTAAAEEYVTLYQTDTAAAEAYLEEKLAAGITSAGVTNAAFVDLNGLSLEWLSKISASATVNNSEVTNEAKLTNFYFQTSRGGATDGTHPNDKGAEACAELFFDYAENEQNYSDATGAVQRAALAGLLDNNRQNGTAKPVSPEVINLGYPSNSAWPIWESAIKYDYPTYIKSVNFDEDNRLVSADVTVQDSMSKYGWAAVAKYDENGLLKSISFGDGQVDNSTGKGTQTISFTNGFILGENETYKGFVWEYEDDESKSFMDRLTMIPYSHVYVPSDVEEYLLLGDDGAVVENFQYYGLGDGADISSVSGTGYSFTGSAQTRRMAAVAETESDIAHLDLFSDGYKGTSANSGSYLLEKALVSNVTSGIVQMDFDVRYNSGEAVIELANGKPSSYPAAHTIKITDGAVTVDSNAAGAINTGQWAHINAEFDLDLETATVTIGGTPTTVSISEIAGVSYLGFVAGTSKAFDYDVANMTVAKLVRKEALPSCALEASAAAECADMGTVSAENGTYSYKTPVTVTALPNDGYHFEGWYDESGNLVSENEVYTFTIKQDTKLTAYFAATVLPDGFTYEDDFESYEIKRYIVQNGNDVSAAPADVTLGGLILSAGYRNNGPGDTISGVYVEGDAQNKYMTAKSGNTASASRGAAIAFKKAISFGDAPVVWSFDTKFTESAVLTVTGIGDYSRSALGISADTWANVEFIFDSANAKQYVIARENGKVVSIKESTLSASELSTMTFYNTNQSISFDNMKVYELGAPTGTAQIPAATTFTVNAAGAVITAAGNTIAADSSGKAVLTLVKGVYDVGAVCAGYEDYFAEITVDDSYAASIEMTAKTADAASVTVNYVDTEGNTVKEPVTIDNLYAGDEYTLDSSYYDEIIKNADNNGYYTLYEFNQAQSNLTITLDTVNEIDVVYTNKGSGWFDYETFDSITGTWGFAEGTSGNVAVENGVLALLKNAGTSRTSSDYKTLDNSIAGTSKLTVVFDWKSNVESAKGRDSRFDLLDGEDNIIFSIYGRGSAGNYYAVGEAASQTTTKLGGSIGDWYSIELELDFEAGVLSGTITNKATGAQTVIAQTNITASGLAKLGAIYVYSAAPLAIDNIGFKNNGI
ncbi:MAG: MucBP domain-containing protein [Clostridiales bacterium]|nr:MucBP domain-containing protein [Clostridiales bacterium]